MTLQNDFILFGSTCTNIDSQGTYAADPNTAGGRPAGILPSMVYNKVSRQASYASTALAQLIVSYGLQPALDNGNVATYAANLVTTIQAIATGTAPVAPPVAPGGRLTLTTGTPLIAADIIGSTIVYYTPTINASFPLYNGSAWTNPQLSGDLSLSLTAAAAANDLVDVFGTYSGATPVIGFGPVWGTNTPGSCARGVGAGTTQISRVNNGLWANTNTITLTNGAASYAGILAGQATYLGTLAIDAVAGQTTCHVSYGQSRKWGVWNAYNRFPIALQAGDATASWTYATPTWRPSNNNSANSILTLIGLPEEFLALEFLQSINSNGLANNGIGINSTTSPTGKNGLTGNALSDCIAKYILPPSLGLNKITALEYYQGSVLAVFYGTSASNVLRANYDA